MLAVTPVAQAQSFTMRMATGEETIELMNAEWSLVSKRRGNPDYPDQVIMADRGTQERDGDFAYIWVRFVEVHHVGAPVAALDIRMQYDCRDGRSRPVSQRLISEFDSQLDRRYEDPDGYFDSPPPQGSIGQKLLSLACSDGASWASDYAVTPVEEDPIPWAHAYMRGE